MNQTADTPWRAVRDTEMAAVIARASAEDPVRGLLQRAGAGIDELRAALDPRPRGIGIALMFPAWRWRAARWRCKRERRLMRIEQAGHRPWVVGLWLTEKLGQVLILIGVAVGVIATALGAIQLNIVIAGSEPSRLPGNQECETMAAGSGGAWKLLFLLAIAVVCGLVLALGGALAGIKEKYSASRAKRRKRVALADERCVTARNAWARALGERFLEPIARDLALRGTPSPTARWRGVLVSMAKQARARTAHAGASLFRRTRRVGAEVASLTGLLLLGGIAASSMLLAVGLAFEWVYSVFGTAGDTCLNSAPGLHLIVALATMLATGLLARWLAHRSVS